MRAPRWPWILATILLTVGMGLFFANIDGVLSVGGKVECGGSPLQPGQECWNGGGGSASYSRQKASDDSERPFGYLGAGLGGLGVAIFAGYGLEEWRQSSAWPPRRRRRKKEAEALRRERARRRAVEGLDDGPG